MLEGLSVYNINLKRKLLMSVYKNCLSKGVDPDSSSDQFTLPSHY